MAEDTTREAMEYDVVVVGAGPAGLATAIRLKERAAAAGYDPSVCVIEKGARVGAHILSGAILDPRALDELIPDAAAKGAPLGTAVHRDRFLFLTEGHALPVWMPPSLSNHGLRILSLGDLTRWLAERAEDLGVEIYTGFAGTDILFNEEGGVAGIVTGDKGVGADGAPRSNHLPGVELRARQTVFAEGCRGSLTRRLIERFGLDRNAAHPTYGLGIKEIWEVMPDRCRPGLVTHSVGWPLDRNTYGGGWVYHLDGNRVSVGFVVGLDYANPHLDPFAEFQRYKTHPALRGVFAGGRRLAFGARTISEGGLQSLPRLTVPGAMIVGDAAGFVNVPRIKGIHTAMKSGMVAAEALADHLASGTGSGEVTTYPEALRQSWLWDELTRVRNIRPAFRWGLLPGLVYSGIETLLLKGRAPWTLSLPRPDHAAMVKATDARPIAYPRPDGRLTFDRASSVQLANTAHEEDQPVHLVVRDADAAIRINRALYDSPETRFCPAGVFEVPDNATPRLVINPSNCVHCKTCDIKDPIGNITWTAPEGDSGPNYPGGM